MRLLGMNNENLDIPRVLIDDIVVEKNPAFLKYISIIGATLRPHTKVYKFKR